MLTHVRRAACVVIGLLIAASALAFAAPASAAQQAIDVFGRPVQPSHAAAASLGSSMTQSSPVVSTAKPPSFSLPEPIRIVIATGIAWQGELNARIADAAEHLRTDASPQTWLALVLLSFAYGVLHAIGPGHGKLVTGTYLGSRKTRPVHAVALCGWTAVVQALSAIVLVFGMTWFAKAGVASVLTQAESLEVVSYALLCVAGAWTFYTCVARGDCCFDPSAIKLVPTGRRVMLSFAASPDGESYLGAKLALRGPARPFARSGTSTFSQIVATGFAAGVRPCVGAIFVLIGSIAARMPLVGMAATFAMAAGVAVTVTVVGLSAVGTNRLMSKRANQLHVRLRAARRWVAASGALLIVLLGAVQVALRLSGYIQPSLT
jgi:nickel/cobalt transporter (NicO) family protein